MALVTHLAPVIGVVVRFNLTLLVALLSTQRFDRHMVYLRNLALVSRVDDLECSVAEHIEVIDHPLELLRLDESLQLHIPRRILSSIRSINALAVNHINDSRDDCVVGGAAVVEVNQVAEEIIVIAILHPAQARVLADLWRGV